MKTIFSLFLGFHSINVPSEWGLHGVEPMVPELLGRVSIQLMSPASGDFAQEILKSDVLLSFHSINVPSEWGLLAKPQKLEVLVNIVSIQLMSPASGDYVLDGVL